MLSARQQAITVLRLASRADFAGRERLLSSVKKIPGAGHSDFLKCGLRDFFNRSPNIIIKNT